MIRRSTLLLPLLAAVTLLVPSLGAAEPSARALRANVASVYTVWDADDVCARPMQTKGCTLDVGYSVCLTRAGCAVESTTGNCVSASRINTTITVNTNINVEYLLAGQTRYCDASDDACSQEQSDKVGIKLCPTRSSEDITASGGDGLRMNNHSAASTEDDENERKDDETEYAPVTTPKGGDSTRAA